MRGGSDRGWHRGVPRANAVPAGRVDDVVRSMYPPLDPKLLDAR